MTTIYDVAQHAGVAISTVSKVLSGRHYVSQKTRERVEAAIADLNYIPQAAARTLAGEPTQMIGVVFSYDPHDFHADPTLVEMLYGIDSAITEKDNVLLLSMPGSTDDRISAFKRFVRGFRVDGVLVESGKGEEGIRMLTEQGYPCVVIGYSQHNLPCVYPDDYTGTQIMTQHLLALGHRRIAAITGHRSNLRAAAARLDGYRDALAAAGVELDEAYIAQGNFRRDSGYQATAALMALPHPPTAIFAFNDRMAFGALRWLREHNYRVPEDVSVVGFDDIAEAEQSDPPLTTIRWSPADVGRRATAMLFDLITHPEQSLEEAILPVELIVRGSAAAVAE